MRQTTVHPYLLESTISEELTKEDIQELRKGLAKLKDESAVHDMVSSWSPPTTGLSMDERLEKAFAQKGCMICGFCACEASNPRIADVSHGSVQKASFLTLLNSAHIHFAANVWKQQWPLPPLPQSQVSSAPTAVRRSRDCALSKVIRPAMRTSRTRRLLHPSPQLSVVKIPTY